MFKRIIIYTAILAFMLYVTIVLMTEWLGISETISRGVFVIGLIAIYIMKKEKFLVLFSSLMLGIFVFVASVLLIG